MQIVGRLDGLFGRLTRALEQRGRGRLSIQHEFCCMQAHGAVASTEDADMRIGDHARSVEIVKRRDAGEGEIAAPTRKLFEPPAAPGRPSRKVDVGQQVVGFE